MRNPLLQLLFCRFARSAFVAIFFLACAQVCHAVVIDFDDILHVPTDGYFYDQPITNEYAAQGLLVSDGYLTLQSDLFGVSSPNALIGGPTLVLNFIGKLPTFVEFTVSAAYDQASFITAIGPSGYLFTKKTGGYAGPEDDTPYIPNQLVSLQAAGGILSLEMTAFYGTRTSCIIDNLHYDYKSLPEPSTFGILLVGLCMLAWRRWVQSVKM